MLASRPPIKMWTRSFGVAAAVAAAKVNGLMVGTVAMAPLESEYGRGHSLIMIRSLKPSRLRVCARASKRLSVATSRRVKDDSQYLHNRKEQNDPTILADAAMNHLA